MPDVTLEVADMFHWLPAHHRAGAVVTVLPDADEIGMGPQTYEGWLRGAASTCFAYSSGPTVFYQTDRMYSGRWQDKAHIITAVADTAGIGMLWHKVVLRRDPGKVDLHRPTWSHLLAFGPGRPGKRRPDVIDAGGYLWRDGMGTAAAAFVADWLTEVGVTTVLNPCCGEGTVVAACADAGLDVYGCDIDAEHVAAAEAAVT